MPSNPNSVRMGNVRRGRMERECREGDELMNDFPTVTRVRRVEVMMNPNNMSAPSRRGRRLVND